MLKKSRGRKQGVLSVLTNLGGVAPRGAIPISVERGV
jgi:hypothetical protein